MRDIDVQSSLILEGDHEAVGETLVLFVRAYLDSPFVVDDGVDLRW